MQPESFKFGGGGETYVHPAVICAIVFAAILIFLLPRKYVVFPFLATAFLIPMDQVIVIGPFHFQMLRVVILLGWLRLLATKISSQTKILSGGINPIDKAVVLWAFFTAVNFLLLWQKWEAFINQMGVFYTTFGIYLLFRFLIRDEEDVARTIRAFAVVAAVVAVIMLVEQKTGRNPYAFFGGAHTAVRQSLLERDDRFRAMASFAHPILAGTFGAILFPLFVGAWWKDKKNRISALTGIIASMTIVIASVSSTPLLAYAAGVLALCLWPLRKSMRLIRWGIAGLLIALHLVMKAPVWALIQRVDVIGGSSGFHRYYLVDQFIRHFGDWWLIGAKDNASWGLEMWDVANQYVSVGVGSGLLPFLLFLSIIVYGFKLLGKARYASEDDKRQELFFWALSAALFSNALAFFGISYFDQTIVVWYAFLAMIAAATDLPLQKMTVAPQFHAGVVSAGKRFVYPVLDAGAAANASFDLPKKRRPSYLAAFQRKRD